MEVPERIKEPLAMAKSFVAFLAHRYREDGCRESAAALTYMSLFAVVPLLTMMYSVFSLVPAFKELGAEVQQLIFDNFLPSSGAEIQVYLENFSRQARQLSAIGAIILIVTSYVMLSNIEKTFNRIWGAVSSRRGLPGFLLYWGILSFGPLLVGIGLMMHTYLISLQLVVDEVDALGITARLLEYLPWIMTWVAFTLLFVAVPNCRVHFRHAAIGGLVTMVLFEIAKSMFGSIVANSSYHTVYGAFAIVPLFLLWIYLSWMLILGGAELVRSLETFGTAYRGHRYSDFIAAVMVCWECWRLQQQGKALSDRDMIRAGLEEQHWKYLRRLMLERHLLVVTSNNRYVLARDPSRLTLWSLVEMFGDNFSTLPGKAARKSLEQFDWYPPLEKVVERAGTNSHELFSGTLGDLFYASIEPVRAAEAESA